MALPSREQGPSQPNLSSREIAEIIDEWKPESLVPPLSEEEKMDAENIPVSRVDKSGASLVVSPSLQSQGLPESTGLIFGHRWVPGRPDALFQRYASCRLLLAVQHWMP